MKNIGIFAEICRVFGESGRDGVGGARYALSIDAENE